MDFNTELKKLNELKITDSTNEEREAQAKKVAEAFNTYSKNLAPKGKRAKTLSPQHFLSRYIPAR